MSERSPSPDRLAQIEAQQRLLGEALTSTDPVARLGERLAECGGDEDGVRVAALLVAKLRFQRLSNASPMANEWFAADPEGFVAAFREYQESIASGALDPWGEAELFARWVEERPSDPRR